MASASPILPAFWLAAFLIGSPAALAQQPLDKVLEGFDEEKPDKKPVDPKGAAPLDNVLEGFDEPAAKQQPKPAEAPAEARWIRFGGAIGQDISYNFGSGAHDVAGAGDTDHRGLSGLRSRIDAEADFTFSPDWRGRLSGHGFQDWAYRIEGRGNFTDRFLDHYENEAEVDDAYVQGRLSDSLDIKVGRQVVVWGKSDNIRITDVLNPLDVRLPGRTDIEDLRLPVVMSKLDYYLGDWNLSAIVVHETRFNKTPVFGSEFYTAAAPAPEDDDPDTGIAGPEFGLALNGIFSGWDLSFYGAYIFDDQAHAEQTSGGLRLRHSRLRMGGAAANVALGNWLLKGEAAYLHGMEFLSTPGEKFSRLDVMAGAEYTGFRDTTLSFEAANRHLFAFDARAQAAPDGVREDNFETAVRFTQTYLNETLELTLLASTHGLTGGNGGFQRLQITYDWTDDIELTAGVINYMSGDKQQFDGVGDNDRLFARIAYRF